MSDAEVDPATGSPPRAAPSRSLRVAAVVLAASGIAAVTFFLPATPRWEVRIDGAGPVRFAGQELAPHEVERLSLELERAGELESLGSRVTLALGEGALVLRLHPGSTLELPDAPDLARGDPVSLRLVSGELYLRTGESALDGALVVVAPELEVRARAAAFGVLVEPGRTCVCVAKGEVELIGARLGGVLRLGAGQSIELPGDPTLAPRTTPFPEASAPAGERASHTRELVRFAGE
jgi:hypothetical protein